MSGAQSSPPRTVSLRHLQCGADALRVEIHDADEAFANMVRRALTDVRILAATHVTFRRNTSAFCNEVLAHRLGLVPLRSTFAEHRPATLRARGPCVVRAGDIEALDFEVAAPHVLVVALGEGEELDCTLHPALSTGKEHARHSAAVATRCARRHEIMLARWAAAGAYDRRADLALRGLPAPLPTECFCVSTAWGTPRCEECAGEKRAQPRVLYDSDMDVDDQCSDPLVFLLEFETTGALAPLDLLRRALETAERASTHVAEQLQRAEVAIEQPVTMAASSVVAVTA